MANKINLTYVLTGAGSILALGATPPTAVSKARIELAFNRIARLTKLQNPSYKRRVKGKRNSGRAMELTKKSVESDPGLEVAVKKLGELSYISVPMRTRLKTPINRELSAAAGG